MQYSYDYEATRRKKAAGGDPSFCFACLSLAVFTVFAVILIALCASILVVLRSLQNGPTVAQAVPVISCPAMPGAGNTTLLDNTYNVPSGQMIITIIHDFRSDISRGWFQNILPDLKNRIAGNSGWSIQYIPIRFLDYPYGVVIGADHNNWNQEWDQGARYAPASSESLVLAAAFHCAADIGMQEEYNEQIYVFRRHRGFYWTNERVIETLQGLGWSDFDQFQTCVNCGTYRAQVMTDTAAVEYYTSLIDRGLPYILDNQFPVCRCESMGSQGSQDDSEEWMDLNACKIVNQANAIVDATSDWPYYGSAYNCNTYLDIYGTCAEYGDHDEVEGSGGLSRSEKEDKEGKEDKRKLGKEREVNKADKVQKVKKVAQSQI